MWDEDVWWRGFMMQDYDGLWPARTCDIQWLLEDNTWAADSASLRLKPSIQDIRVMTISSLIMSHYVSFCLIPSRCLYLFYVCFFLFLGFPVDSWFVPVSGRTLGAGWSGGLLFAPSVHCLSLKLAARHPGRFWCCVPWAQRKRHSCWMLLDGCCKGVFFDHVRLCIINICVLYMRAYDAPPCEHTHGHTSP